MIMHELIAIFISKNAMLASVLQEFVRLTKVGISKIALYLLASVLLYSVLVQQMTN